MKFFQFIARCLVAYLCFVGSTGAQNLVTTQAYWEDPTGTVPFAQAREQHFTPYQGALNQGYTPSTTWLRVRIDHQTGNPEDRHIVLRVLPNFLDEIELFDPLDPRDKPRVTGDLTSYTDQEYKSLPLGFVMPVGEEDRDVWLRLRTTSASVIQVDAYGENAMQAVDRNFLITALACLGLLLFLGLFNFFSWLWDREWLYTVFVFRTFLLFLILSIYFGVAGVVLDDWIHPSWLDHAFNFGILIAVVASCYFEFGLLGEYGLKSWTHWPKYVIYACMAICIGLYVLDRRLDALRANAIVVLFMFLSLAFITLAGLKNSVPQTNGRASGIHKSLFFFYYLLIIATHPFLQIWVFNLLDIQPQILIMLAAYAINSSIYMTLIIQFRAANIRKNQHFLQTQVALLDERIRHEHLRRAEQGNLLSMLMHEVRNPLAVIDVAQNQNNPESNEMIRRNVNIIRSVLDRALNLEKINDDQLQISKASFLFSDCLTQAIDDACSDDHRIVLTYVPDVYIHTDFESLRTILVNLLGNALKYSPPNEAVQIDIRHEALPAQLNLAVINRIGACGKPDPDHVFDKYYRGEGAKKLPGTGVGLYLVQQLAQRLGGTCRYTSDAEWVRFELSLPVSTHQH